MTALILFQDIDIREYLDIITQSVAFAEVVLKVTICNNFTLFEVWFYRQLVFILIAYGHVKDR